MRDVLLFALALLTTWIVLLTLAVLVLRSRLQKRNRVSPAVRTPAPLTWLVSPSQTARLHRRLRNAMVDVHLAPSRRSRPATECSIDEFRRELELQAIELDHHLVVAARHPRSQRRVLLDPLQSQVAQVEQLSIRLSRMQRPDGSLDSGWDLHAQPPEVMARIGHQLDLLDAASDELAQIERAAGLVDVETLLLQGSPTPAPMEARLVAPFASSPAAVTPPPPPALAPRSTD